MKATYAVSTKTKRPYNIVLAIGIFDGVHRGHQELIKRAVRRARRIGGQAHVLTFHPHPVHVLHPQKYQPLITSLEHRLILLEGLGITKTIVVPFTKKFSRITPEKFVKDYLVKEIHPKEIFVGDDFRFGQDRAGTLDFFKEAGKRYGFKVHGITTVKMNSGKIGSTAIRALIAEGALQKAKKLLGRNVSIFGKVIRGDARGRKLGFPTANVDLQSQVIPPGGVYAARVGYKGKHYGAMANLGFCPTFTSGQKAHQANCEVHIFKFKGTLYGKKLIVEFIQRFRDEQCFSSSDELKKQLQNDQKEALRILSHQ